MADPSDFLTGKARGQFKLIDGEWGESRIVTMILFALE